MTTPHVGAFDITLSNISGTYKGYFPVQEKYTTTLQKLSDALLTLAGGHQELNLSDTSKLTRVLFTEAELAPVRQAITDLRELTENGINGQYVTDEMYNGKLDNFFLSLYYSGILGNVSGNPSFQNPANGLDLGGARVSGWICYALWCSRNYNAPTPPVQVVEKINGSFVVTASNLPFGHLASINVPLFNLNNLVGGNSSDITWLNEFGSFSQVSDNIFNDIVKAGVVAQVSDNPPPGTPLLVPNIDVINVAGVPFGVPHSSTNSALFQTYTGTIQGVLNAAFPNGSLSSGQIALLNQSFGNLLKLAKDGLLTSAQISSLNNIFSSLAEFSSSALFGPAAIYSTSGWDNGANNTLTGVSTTQWQAWFQAVLVNPGVLQPAVTVLSASGANNTINFGDISYIATTQLASNAAVTTLYDGVVDRLTDSHFNPNVDLYYAIDLMVNGDRDGHYITPAQLSSLKALLPDLHDTEPFFNGFNMSPGTRIVEWGGVPRVMTLSTQNPTNTDNRFLDVIRAVLARDFHNLTTAEIADLNNQLQSGYGNFVFSEVSPLSKMILHSISSISTFLAPIDAPQYSAYGVGTVGNTDFVPWSITDTQWQNWIEAIASNPGFLEPYVTTESLLPTATYATISNTLGASNPLTIDGTLIPTATGKYGPISTGTMTYEFETVMQLFQDTMTDIYNSAEQPVPAQFSSVIAFGWRGISDAQLKDLRDAIGQLIYLARNGDGDGNYLSQEQVRLINNIFVSLSAGLAATVPHANFAAVTTVPTLNNNAILSDSSQLTTYTSTLSKIGMELWFNTVFNKNLGVININYSLNNPTPISSFFRSANDPTPFPTLSLISLAGSQFPILVSETDWAPYTTYKDNIRTILQQASLSTGVDFLTSDQIAGLNQNVGELLYAANRGLMNFANPVGLLSQGQVLELNSFFQALANFSTNTMSFITPPGGFASPLFPDGISAGWFPDSQTHVLTGISDSQWQDFFQGILISQGMIEPFISADDLLPTQVVTVGGITYEVKVSSAQTDTIKLPNSQNGLSTEFSILLNSLNTATAGLDPFAPLTRAKIEEINAILNKIIPVVIRGDNQGHYLTTSQYAQFQAAVNNIPNDGVHAAFLDVAGIANYVLPAEFASESDSALFSQLVTQLNITLQSALFPDVNGDFKLTSAQIATLDQLARQALTIALVVQNTSVGWGATVQTGRYTIDQLNAFNALLKTLSQVSSRAVATSDETYTGGWNAESSLGFLNADATKNAKMWNDWLQLVVDNPDILAPLLKATDILPIIFYDSNGLIPVAVNRGIDEDPSVTGLFDSYEQTFQGILQAAVASGTLTIPQMAQLNQVVGQFTNLARFGDGNGHYVSEEQAGKINNFFQSLKSFPATVGISVPSFSLDENSALAGMSPSAWTAWYYTLLNSPTQIFNQTRVYTLGTTLTEYPITWSSVGSVNIQSKYNALIQSIQIALNSFGPSSDPTVLNGYLQELITLAQTGDASGNLLSAAEAANIGNIFTALSSYAGNPGWTTVTNDVRTVSVTAAQWVAVAPVVNAIQTISAPPNTVGVIIGGVYAFVPVSATATASLNTSLESIKNSIKAVLQDAASAGAVGLTPDQMQKMQQYLAQLYLLLQNGDGQGHYFTQAEVSGLFNALNNISFFASLYPTQPQYQSPGWEIVQGPPLNITGISQAQWNLWYHNLVTASPNAIAPLATPLDVLPTFQYNFGGLPNTSRPVFPASIDPLSPSVVFIQGIINSHLTPIQAALQKAAGKFTGPHYTNPLAVLTADEITDLKGNIGDLVKLAQDVILSLPQAQNINSLLQSLLAVVPTGWTLPATFNQAGHFDLGGISDPEWNRWFTQIFSNPAGLSTLFPTGSAIDLSYSTLLAAGYIPTATIHLAGVSTTIVTPNVAADSDLLASYNTQVSGIAGIIQEIVAGGFTAGSVLNATEVGKLNQYVGQLINLAQNGDSGNLLTPALAIQLDQLVTSLSAFSSTSLSGANHTNGWSLNASQVLQGVSTDQWSRWVENLLANPTTVSAILQRDTVTVAGIPTSLWVAVTSSSEPQVDDAYTQLVHDVRLLIQQMKAAGVSTLTPAQVTTLNQAVGLLVYLVRNDGLNGYAITDTMAQNINTLFASLDDFSTTTVVSTAPNYTAGWVLDNTGALTVAGVNGATSTSITTAQWQSWINSVLATPAQLSPLYPPDFLSSLSLADAGVVPSTTLDIAGVLKKVQVAPSMSDAVTMAFNTNMQGIKNVVIGFVAMGLTNPTTAQISPYIEILNKNVGALMGMVEAGSLTASAANSLNVLLTSLSAYSTTTVASDNPAFSAGWIPSSNFVSETAVIDTQWLNWLKFVTAPENRNTLNPFIPPSSFGGPFLTLNLGPVMLNLPFSVITTNELNSRYNTLVGDIGDILKASKTSTALTASQITQLRQDVGTLLYLAQYGDGRGNVLTIEMQKNLSLLASSLTASGAQTFALTPSGVNAYSIDIGDVQLWNVWRDLALSSNMLQGFLKSENATINAQRSLQAMVELNYVKLGNDMLATQLTGLQSALNTTQTILNTLTGLQNIHNQIIVSSKISFSAFFNPSAGMKSVNYRWKNPVTFQEFGGSSGKGFEAAYKYYASAYFGVPVAPTIALPEGSKYQMDINNPNNWLVEILYNQPPLDFGYTGKVNTFSPTNTTGSGKSSSTSSANTTYEGYYIQVPNNFVVPQSVINQFHLRTPSSIVASVSLLVPGRPASTGDFGIGHVDATPDTYTKLLQPLFTGGKVGNITQKEGYTLWITSTSFPATLDPRSNSQFTTSSTNFTALRSILDKLDELKPAGYTYENKEGLRTLTPPAKDTLKTFVTQTLGGFPTGLTSTINNLLFNKATLSAQLATLAELAPSTVTDPNSLYSMTKKVYDDLKNSLVTRTGAPITTSTSYAAGFSGLAKWLLDGYSKLPGETGAVQAGRFQQNITFAVTAAQSLNSQQQQKVSNYLFVFEEFQKSAAAILQQLTQIIQHIAQNIAR